MSAMKDLIADQPETMTQTEARAKVRKALAVFAYAYGSEDVIPVLITKREALRLIDAAPSAGLAFIEYPAEDHPGRFTLHFAAAGNMNPGSAIVEG